ncbi:MAG: TIGR03067 domain-containing protein [Gemmataceae bacterium]|nr:TIGR03067 domain-containing protein [Gemmataceae bacterium]
MLKCLILVRWLGLAGFLAVAVLAADLMAAPGLKEPKDELKHFEGDWTFESWQQSGEQLPEDLLKTASWTVKGDRYTFELAGDREEGTIKLDPSRKPAALELKITEGKDKGKTQVGIYKFDGDKIIICLAQPGEKERPADFATTEDDDNILVVIRRVKK